MTALHVIHGIVARDLRRARRQGGRLIGGLARPFMWLLLVATGFQAIARVEGAASYREFVFPGVVVMAALFGGMLTAISTVYDREFGMLRLMLASPAGPAAVLAGRALAAALVGLLQGGVVLAVAPLLVEVTGPGMVAALGALALGALSSATLGSLVAARLRSVENFAGVINLVLFPLLFLSGALYPTSTLPAPLAVAARLNPVTYQVDLLRHALGQPTELGAASDAAALVLTTLVAFVLATALFDPERRLAGARSRGADGASGSAAGPR